MLRPKIDGEISLRHLRANNATARQMSRASVRAVQRSMEALEEYTRRSPIEFVRHF
jgi:hypothetical protein